MPDIEKLKRKENFKALIKALNHKDRYVRKKADEALGEIVDKRAVEPLLEALNHPRFGNYEYLFKFLGEIGDERAVEPLIQYIISDLNKYNSSISRRAIEALVKIGEPAVEPLIRILKDFSVHRLFRIEAAECLGQIGDKRAVEPLIIALNDKEVYVRKVAARALGEFRDERAVEPLINALKATKKLFQKLPPSILKSTGPIRFNHDHLASIFVHNMDVESAHREITKALGKIGHPWAVQLLIQILKDEFVNSRKTAAEALGQIGDPRAVEPLIQVLKDKDEDVREMAAEALGKIGKPAVEPLIQTLNDNDPWIRKTTAKTLGNIGDPRAVEPLNRTLNDEYKKVRQAAAIALKKIKESGVK